MTIDITLVPTLVYVRGVNKSKQRYAFLHREDQTPELIMKDVHVKEGSEVGQSNTYCYGEYRNFNLHTCKMGTELCIWQQIPETLSSQRAFLCQKIRWRLLNRRFLIIPSLRS